MMDTFFCNPETLTAQALTAALPALVADALSRTDAQKDDDQYKDAWARWAGDDTQGARSQRLMATASPSAFWALALRPDALDVSTLVALTPDLVATANLLGQVRRCCYRRGNAPCIACIHLNEVIAAVGSAFAHTPRAMGDVVLLMHISHRFHDYLTVDAAQALARQAVLAWPALQHRSGKEARALGHILASLEPDAAAAALVGAHALIAEHLVHHGPLVDRHPTVLLDAMIGQGQLQAKAVEGILGAASDRAGMNKKLISYRNCRKVPAAFQVEIDRYLAAEAPEHISWRSAQAQRERPNDAELAKELALTVLALDPSEHAAWLEVTQQVLTGLLAPMELNHELLNILPHADAGEDVVRSWNTGGSPARPEGFDALLAAIFVKFPYTCDRDDVQMLQNPAEWGPRIVKGMIAAAFASTTYSCERAVSDILVVIPGAFEVCGEELPWGWANQMEGPLVAAYLVRRFGADTDAWELFGAMAGDLAEASLAEVCDTVLLLAAGPAPALAAR